VPKAAIRLLIVDDDERFIAAVEAMLESADDIEVIGRAANGDEALRRAGELLPDVITMDIQMPVMDGVDATRMISHYFKVPIVVLTGSDSGQRVQEALAAGAVARVGQPRLRAESSSGSSAASVAGRPGDSVTFT
jgi:two-component system, chemotaxis family, protein-glutamate methylesterase/glutaminase